jgi:tetrahydromethanopterin S-methyltransferase subunit G
MARKKTGKKTSKKAVVTKKLPDIKASGMINVPEVKMRIGSPVSRLSVLGLGLAVGIALAVFMLLTGLSAWLLNFGNAWVELLSAVYIGFEATFLGSIIGAIWGFVDGFICGIIIAWIYNRLR